jgi:putative transposase
MTAAVKGKGQRRSRTEWREIMERFECSDLGVEPFCQREGLSLSSFWRWRRLLRSTGEAIPAERVPETGPSFVEAGVLNLSGAGPWELTLELGGGLVLHLKRG